MSRGGVNLRGIFSLFGISRANERDYITQRINETANISGTQLLANQGPNGLNLIDPRVWTTERTFLAVLVNAGPNGEADRSDDRYWAITVDVGQDASDGPDDAADVYPDNSYGTGLWITAHNTSEIVSGAHALTTIAPPTDYGQALPANATVVRVHEQHCIKTDVGTVPNVKYIFEAAISSLTIHVTSNASLNGSIRFTYSGTMGYWNMANNTSNGGTWTSLGNTTVKAFNSAEDLNTFTGNGTVGTGNTVASANGTVNGGSCKFLPLPNGYYNCVPRGSDSNGTAYYTIINAMNSAQ